MIEAIQQVDGAQVAGASSVTTEMPLASRFAAAMEHEVANTNAQLVAADDAVQQLAAGEAVPLHEVMLRLEEARLGFQTLAAFRNKVLDAYQEVMRMQV